MLSYGSRFMMSAPRYGHTPYAEITGPTGHLARLEPFAGNSLWAEWQDEDHYVVYSYATPIGIARKTDVDGEVLVNLNRSRYSVTTSKHQGYVAAWLGHAFQRVEV